MCALLEQERIRGPLEKLRLIKKVQEHKQLRRCSNRTLSCGRQSQSVTVLGLLALIREHF